MDDLLPRALRGLPASDDNQLSWEIRRLYDARKQTATQLSEKKDTRAELEYLLKLHFSSDARVHIVGSTSTEFATSNSDMDIVLTTRVPSSDLSRAHQILKNHSYMVNLEFRQGPTVKVPIIRGRDPKRNVDWELSFNKTDSIIKTKLLRAYSLLDARVAPLVVTVKAWAGDVGVKNAHEGTLSSFSWTLMVICYLQNTSPPVLPCLQKDYPGKYGDVSSFAEAEVNIFESPPWFSSRNTNGLGELLRGFFDFYVNKFRYESQAISVREGSLIPKYNVSGRQPTSQWKYFCIEEPYGFVRTNTAGAMFKPDPCTRVVSALRTANTQLTRDNTLPRAMFEPDPCMRVVSALRTANTQPTRDNTLPVLNPIFIFIFIVVVVIIVILVLIA